MPTADRLVELFHRARTHAAGVERGEFLAEVCRDTPGLREQLLSLLEADQQMECAGFLRSGPIISPAGQVTENPGDRIGPYKLLEKLGEGGCGVVYMAEQETPVRRQVAFKAIKLGMDTREVIARFEAERQALAMMDHPNIAKVFDAGVSNTSRPYFVMELVRGIKITKYCDDQQLSTEERLKLFVQVCQAVHHAHQKGIIHRDLKPSNILVAKHDTRPVP
jgi:serine/threonine protein kinase